MTARMTKGNFEALAHEIRWNWPDDERERIGYQTAISAVADACEASSNLTPNGNRAFDRAGFLEACETPRPVHVPDDPNGIVLQNAGPTAWVCAMCEQPNGLDKATCQFCGHGH